MRRRLTVTLADSHAAAAEEVAAALREAGLEVEQVLPALGVVTGLADDEQLAAIAALPGVASVEEETTFRIPPPDADVQ